MKTISAILLAVGLNSCPETVDVGTGPVRLTDLDGCYIRVLEHRGNVFVGSVGVTTKTGFIVRGRFSADFVSSRVFAVSDRWGQVVVVVGSCNELR